MKTKIAITILLLLSCLSFTTPFDLQTAIDEAPNGGTVVVPCGVYDIGDVVIASNTVWQKVVTLQGCGHAHLGQAPGQGSSQWDYLINGGHSYGTVLRGTISVQKGTYAGAVSAKAYIRDLSMIGYGSGIAIDYGDGTNMFPEGGVQNVSIGNYDIGIRLRRSYYMTIDDVSMAGVGTGLLNESSNVITVSGLNISSCGTGINVTGNGNTYTGGSVQACNSAFILGGFSSILQGFYFEQNTAGLLVSGRGHTIASNYYASNSGGVSITGHNNQLYASESSPIAVSGNYNRISLSAYGVCNDTGFKNQCTKLYP